MGNLSFESSEKEGKGAFGKGGYPFSRNGSSRAMPNWRHCLDSGQVCQERLSFRGARDSERTLGRPSALRISRFRVWFFGPSRNDELRFHQTRRRTAGGRVLMPVRQSQV